MCHARPKISKCERNIVARMLSHVTVSQPRPQPAHSADRPTANWRKINTHGLIGLESNICDGFGFILGLKRGGAARNTSARTPRTLIDVFCAQLSQNPGPKKFNSSARHPSGPRVLLFVCAPITFSSCGKSKGFVIHNGCTVPSISGVASFSGSRSFSCGWAHCTSAK